MFSIPIHENLVFVGNIVSRGNVNQSISDVIPEHLKCPICIEVFGAEIYLCRNGHIICDRCTVRVGNSCPQCRVPLEFQEGRKTRVYAMESHLDYLMPFCPYKTAGCTERILKKKYEAHMINCIYNGKCVQLCKQLGYDTCNFWTNGLNARAAVEHFGNQHKVVVVGGNSVDIPFGNFGRVINQKVSDDRWAPVIMSVGGFHFITQTLFNAKDRTLSWICLKLNYENNVPATRQNEVEFCIMHPLDMKSSLKWKTPTVSLLDYGKMVKFPPLRTPAKLLCEDYCNSEQKLIFRVTVSGAPANYSVDNSIRQPPEVSIVGINPRNRLAGSGHGQVAQ